MDAELAKARGKTDVDLIRTTSCLHIRTVPSVDVVAMSALSGEKAADITFPLGTPMAKLFHMPFSL
jgi:hypothetical protein